MSDNDSADTVSPLIYDDTIDTSSIQRILFVNSGAKPLETYANATTFTIVYESSSSTKDIWELMRRKFPSQDSFITRIGFAFHNHGDLTRFCNQETWFSSADLEEGRLLEFSQNAQFMFDFLREFKQVKHVDFLACKTLQSEKWRKYYQLIQTQTGVIVAASDDDTGNVKYGGDWILESTMEDIREVYFTTAVENYTSLLIVAPYTSLNNYHYTFYTVSEYTPTVMSRTVYDNVGNLIDTTDISYGGQTITNALATMNGGGTNPFTLGIVDSSRNKIKMDVAYSNVYTKALNTTQKTKLMSYVNTTFKEPHTIFTYQYVVTVSGGSYWIATFPSVTPVKTPTITFTAGSTYIFDQSHVSNIGKPIVLYSSTGTTYTTGVTTIGTVGQSVNAYTQVIIPSGFSESLAYYLPGPVDLVDGIRLKYNKKGLVTGTNNDTGADTPSQNNTSGSVYGRLTAISGDGKVYAITSGPFYNSGYSYIFRVFSAINNEQIGGNIINSNASLRTRNIGLNYDGTIFFAKSQWSYGLGNTGEFVAHEFSNNAWTLKGNVVTPNTVFPGGGRYGCNFAASDNGNLVHIAYNFSGTTSKRVIETYVYDSTLTNKYSYKNMKESDFPNTLAVDSQNGQYISGTRDGTRIATGLITGNLTVYDYNVANHTYTQVGNSPTVSSAVISTKISSNGTTVCTMDNTTNNKLFKIYDLLNGEWKLSFSGSTSYTATLPKINSTGSILASTSLGSNNVYYYIRNESDLSYSLTRTMDLSYNVRDFHSTAFSDNLYSFVFGRNDVESNKGSVDVYTI